MYGDGPLLREAVTSVLEQDDPGWRLTVLDDGVEEGRSGDLAGWLAALEDDRIRYLPNPRRLGINRNFQRCVDESTADLVVLLGADDRLLPHFVRRARQVAARFPEASWFHTGAAVIDHRGRRVLPLVDRVKGWTRPRVDGVRQMRGEELATSLLHGNWMIFPSCVFRGESLRRHGFRPGYDIVLDLDLYLRILLDGGSAVFLEEPCIEYRRHASSLSSTGATAGSRFDEEDRYFAEIGDVLTRAGWGRAGSAARWHWTSRAHALTKLPALVRTGGFRAGRDVLTRTVTMAHRVGTAVTPMPVVIPAPRSAEHDAENLTKSSDAGS
ncbi:glycosyltransferase [Pseudonocardia pini]|uniref:glycosyltransferase n=1 Tax=Pseudonocardia pini TaxID=2758030 RepID=UPI0015F00C78